MCLRCRKDACGRMDPCFLYSDWSPEVWNLFEAARREIVVSDNAKRAKLDTAIVTGSPLLPSKDPVSVETKPAAGFRIF